MKLLSHYTRGMTQADYLIDEGSAWSVNTTIHETAACLSITCIFINYFYRDRNH